MSGHKLHTVIMNIENHATFNTPGVEASMPSASLTQFAAMCTKTAHACQWLRGLHSSVGATSPLITFTTLPTTTLELAVLRSWVQ